MPIVIGDPDNLDCSCPICAAHAEAGVPLNVLGPDGEIVEVMPEKKPQFDIVVCGSASTWPELPPEPCTIAVPVGCTVGDLLEALCYDDPALRSLYPPGALYAKLSGRRCERDLVLSPGDVLHVFGKRDPAGARALAMLMSSLG